MAADVRRLASGFWLAALLFMCLPAAACFAEDAGAGARYDSSGRRDPFAALVRDGKLIVPVTVDAKAGGQQSTAVPILRGILWDEGGRSIALMDDDEVQRGDTIHGFEVVEIRRDAVVLSRAGKEIVLQLAVEGSPVPPRGGGDQQ